MDDEGVVADVLFHGAQSVERKPFDKCGDLDLEAKGKRIYNRWLAEFVSSAPERHVGVADLPMWDVDQALADVTVARRMGLTAANLPAPRRSLPDYNLPIWEPFWSACEDLGIPLVCHAGVGDSPHYEGREAVALFLAEVQWYGRRAFQYLTLGGVFERHPRLKLVFTEQRTEWVGDMLRELDSLHQSYLLRTSGLHEICPRLPSEYWQEHCYVGASFVSRRELEQRDDVGVERLMWGSDYPHVEGTYGFTEEHLRFAFAEVPENDAARVLGDNAIDCFGLDREALRGIADRIGPSVDVVATPLDAAPDDYVGHAFRTRGSWS
jgi:predicted TIM-barrel fold metal-dependent hydrolase